MAAKRTIGYVQLEWTCPNCGTRNPGANQTCLNCGAPQPENVQFERAADEKLVTDENALRAAQAGADVICAYCGTRNPAAARTCSQCGSDLQEGKARASGSMLAAATGPTQVTCANCGTLNAVSRSNCFKCGAALPRAGSPPQAAAAKVGTASAAKKKTNWLMIGGIGAALLACCAAILFLFVFPAATVQGTVADVQWQTSVPVQEIHAVSYSNESGSPPSDAYNVSCHTESRDVCEQHTVDKGNGYGEVVEECHTEYQDYCSYTRDEWTTVQTYSLDGHDTSPDYANPSLTNDQRLGSPSTDFTVYFDTEKGQKTYSPGDVTEFQQFQIGTTWTLKLNALGAVISVTR
jgi:ribosomal protein L40E